MVSELYTVTVLMEAAMMGADIDGDALVYLDMAQVQLSLSHCKMELQTIVMHMHTNYCCVKCVLISNYFTVNKNLL